MVPNARKSSLLAIAFLAATFAVFVLLQLIRVPTATALESPKSGADTPTQPEAVDIPGTGYWILVPNLVTSTLYMINTLP